MTEDIKKEVESLRNKFGLTEEEIEGYIEFFKKIKRRIFNIGEIDVSKNGK